MDNTYQLGTFYNQITKAKPLLYQYQYVIEFVGNGGFWLDYNFKPFTLFNDNTDSPDENFSYWAQSASLPSFEIGKADVNFYGATFHTPTCMKYAHDFKTNILLDQDFTMYKKLETWLKMISRYELSGGGIKTIPTCKLRVKLLNSEHKEFTTSMVYEGVWITSLGSKEFTYGTANANPIYIDVNFKYQYAYRDDELDLTMDPLSATRIALAYS